MPKSFLFVSLTLENDLRHQKKRKTLEIRSYQEGEEIGIEEESKTSQLNGDELAVTNHKSHSIFYSSFYHFENFCLEK